ncbi:hypothetical protein M0804_007710 [Polistes exclamans]|nr:hypothetical protein M0804_007710 [Polistes exclamans]
MKVPAKAPDISGYVYLYKGSKTSDGDGVTSHVLTNNNRGSPKLIVSNARGQIRHSTLVVGSQTLTLDARDTQRMQETNPGLGNIQEVRSEKACSIYVGIVRGISLNCNSNSNSNRSSSAAAAAATRHRITQPTSASRRGFVRPYRARRPEITMASPPD